MQVVRIEMNIWELDKALLFLALVLPGFISLKIYSWIIAIENRDYSKSVVEAVCYSVLNFVFFFWLLIIISKDGFIDQHPLYYWLAVLFTFIIAPTIWPFLFVWLSTLKIFKAKVLSPYKQPWDYVFSRRESYWVEIKMKNGETIRGKYALKSMASSYPAERQIYLEELWLPVEGRKFGKKSNRTLGVLISQDEISYLKFYGK
jgi:hypothetical protein